MRGKPFQKDNHLGKPFTKGVSGNPKGRRPSDPLRKLIHPLTPKLIETLFAIVCDETRMTRDRITAAIALLDRGYGKPVQPLAGPDGRPLEAPAAGGGVFIYQSFDAAQSAIAKLDDETPAVLLPANGFEGDFGKSEGRLP